MSMSLMKKDPVQVQHLVVHGRMNAAYLGDAETEISWTKSNHQTEITKVGHTWWDW